MKKSSEGLKKKNIKLSTKTDTLFEGNFHIFSQ